MRELYDKVNAILETVCFDSIWAGFAPCDFVLYDEEVVCFKDKMMPWDNRFLGNTAKEIDGLMTAIWSVPNPDDEDAELLVMGIVHEMFHVFQQQGKWRRADEFAIFAYPHDLDNYRLKMRENHYLAKALSENSLAAIELFIALRHARRHIIGDAINQELLIETFEGAAEYAGLMALKQVSQEKYLQQVQRHINYICDVEKLFNMRRVSCIVGGIACLVLDLFDIDFYQPMPEGKLLIELLQFSSSKVDSAYFNFKQDLQGRFDEFHKTAGDAVERNSLITGFDPMNMERLGDEILCNNFIVLDGEFIQGPVLLIMENGSQQKVKGYVKQL